jgi:hypothetical protein
VLGWITGVPRDFDELERIFYANRFGRRVDTYGGAPFGSHFRHWRLYAEWGVAHQPIAVWLNQESSALECSGEMLAHNTVACAPDRRHLGAVADPQFFATRFRSPQPELCDLSTEDWRPARRLPEYIRRRPSEPGAVQAPLFVAGRHEARREASPGEGSIEESGGGL